MKFNLKKVFFGLLFGVALTMFLHWLCAQFQVRRDILWTGRSDEYRCTCLGIYNAALEQLRKNVFGLDRPWAVAMDVDDTCLSSAEYRKYKKLWRTLFYRPRWSNWCRKGEDRAVPGAAEFTRKVRDLGGKIVLITNRPEELREPTERNLKKEGIEYDALLMGGPGRSKEIWREKIESGKAVPEFQALKIVMLIGDSRTDFPSDFSDRKCDGEWGRKYFVIPNPMNGVWMKF
jgi:5'-nucleotidase (lipoprotein e(P4) family)